MAISCVRRLEDLPGRDDVEQGEPRHPLGMVEGEPVRDPGAAIVADEREAVEAERRMTSTWSPAIARFE